MNETDRNPYFIDTVGTISVLHSRIVSIRWEAPAAVAGNAVVIENAQAKVLWQSKATGPNYVEAEHWEYNAPLVADGIVVPTLDAGSLWIQLKP